MSGPTVGVLSATFGGAYHGLVLGGVARATAAAGGRLVAIQTLDAGTVNVDLAEPPAFRVPVAWDHIDGVVVVLNAADAAYLSALREAGKPVVMISDTLPDFRCPVVLPDNRVGVREAVCHLIAHGHRDIAFAGNPVQRDMVERYAAYRDALAEHGIEPRPDLFFDTGNNQRTGGERAARRMIAAGMPSTAVITGNDLNAFGLVATLLDAGYELPRDQAVVGFDDWEEGIYIAPRLASVRQRFDHVGARAVELLLDDLAGRDVPWATYHVPTSFVARESCGCPDTLAPGPVWDDERPPITSPAELRTRLAAVLRPEVRDMPALDESVDVLVAAIGADGPAPRDLKVRLERLYRLDPHPEVLTDVLRCVRSYGAHIEAGCDRPQAARRVREQVDDILSVLTQCQARAQFREGKRHMSTLDMQQSVSMDLLRSHEQAPRTLGWIRSTHARGGCLGLWSSGDGTGAAPADRPLDVVAVVERDHRHDPPSEPVPPRAFPPAEFAALADLDADEMLYIIPVKVDDSDWGMLAFVGPIEAELATGREMMNQWAALLTIALDHEDVLGSLRAREEQLRHAALYDALTGLANRSLFLDRLAHAIASARRRPDYHFAVLMLDLDGFKVVNDSLGHLAGDRLLVEIAARLRRCVRETDVAARFGGDEFAVLLDDIVDPDSVVAVAERIHDAVRAPVQLGDDEVAVTTSIGIARSTTEYDFAEDVIRDADSAMYAAKWRAKGSTAVFNEAMRDLAVGRLRTEAQLRRALDLGELEVHYQPVVRLDTERVTAVEALLRWRHPDRGLLGPDEFLEIAEDSGLTLPIGRWVLGEACRQLRRWRRSGLADGVQVAVNVSNRQFWHGHLVDDVRECLDTAGLDAGALVLEFTERSLLHDVELAARTLGELRALGIELHIDDFGTGYSSLEALHRLPIDALKIDRSCVARLSADGGQAGVVDTIVTLGANLGMRLIAEGIETPAQRDLLRAAGCETAQGFLFSPPVPPAEFPALLRRLAQRRPAAVNGRGRAGAGTVSSARARDA